ncbi:MAG TPA: DinB family protein [Burkholderiaceae bacterium]|nr:DinB family protein [Burkholderiaceae bacterium]
MRLVAYLRIQARANALANHRLHAAMAALADADFHAPRVSFFPSLAATLNHILAVDLYYVGALHGDTDLVQKYRAFIPAATLAELATRQRASDARLIAWCDALEGDAAADAVIAMERRDHVQHERAGHVLAHLFMHQTHHRGQVHAMLSGTAVSPPQLDEFMMPSEAQLRAADMAALGWSEAEVYGTS